jgi:hypothetical protein
MAPGMTRVGFPRFVRTELRDFFYLALRPAALAPPSPAVCPRAAAEGTTRVPPQAWRCDLGLRGGRSATLHQLELRRVAFSLASSESADALPPLSWPVDASRRDPTGPALVIEPGPLGGSEASIRDRQAAADPERGAIVLTGVDPGRDVELGFDPDAPGLLAAVGVDGELAIATVNWSDARRLGDALASGGFSRTIFVRAGADRLVATPDATPMALRIFGDTRPVPPRVWAPIHARAQERIVALGLTRQYVQIRDYRDREPLERR